MCQECLLHPSLLGPLLCSTPPPPPKLFSSRLLNLQTCYHVGLWGLGRASTGSETDVAQPLGSFCSSTKPRVTATKHRQRGPSAECCSQQGTLKGSNAFSDRAFWFHAVELHSPTVFPMSANDTLSSQLLRPESLESPLTHLFLSHPHGFLQQVLSALLSKSSQNPTPTRIPTTCSKSSLSLSWLIADTSYLLPPSPPTASFNMAARGLLLTHKHISDQTSPLRKTVS